MATKGDELNTRITATDDASTVVDRVRDKVADLEDTQHDVDLGADTSDADREMRALDARLDGLTNEERRVVLEFAAKDAQREIDRINRDLARAQKYDDTEISIRTTARGDAERRLQAIQSEIREIDGSTPEIRPEVDSASIDALIAKLNDLDVPIGRAGDSLSRLGGGAGKAGAVGALVAGLGLAAGAAANTAVAADNLATLTGASVEQASRLNAVWNKTGLDVKDLQDVLLQMAGVLSDDEELARQLGVNMNDGRDLTQRFVQVVELLGEKYSDAGERGVVASRLFGEEGVRQVNQVTNAVGDLNSAMGEIPQSQIFTDADVDNARKMNAELAEFTSNLGGIVNTIGAPLFTVVNGPLGAVNDVFREGTEYSEQIGRNIRSWFDGGSANRNREIVEEISEAEQAAAGFDRELIKNARSVDQVRQAAEAAGLPLHAINLITVEWAKENEHLTGTVDALDLAVGGVDAQLNKLRDTAIQTRNDMAAMLEGGFDPADLDAFNAQLGLTRDELDELYAAAAPPWQRMRDEISQTAAMLEGAPGWFDDLEAAADRGLSNVANKWSSLFSGLEVESTVNSIAAQWDRVLEAQATYWEADQDESRSASQEWRDYRDELIRFAQDVAGFADEVGNIPNEKLIRLRAAIEDDDLTAVQAAIQAIFENQEFQIRLGVTAPSRFTRNEDGSYDRTDAGSSTRVVEQPTVTPLVVEQHEHHHYSIAPTPQQTTDTARDFELANGGNRYR